MPLHLVLLVCRSLFESSCSMELCFLAHPVCLVRFSGFVSFVFFLALSGLRSPRFPSSNHVPVSPVLSCLVRGALPSLNVRALISAWCLLLLEGLLVPC